MKERPILFSAPMVRAVRDGIKTQTRRTMRKQFASDAVMAEIPATSPEGWVVSGHSGLWWDDAASCIDDAVRCPYGIPGDQLWGREAWRTVAEANGLPPRDLTPAHRIWYESDAPHQAGAGKLRPGMFMPRWASRLTLEITGVRVERLQEISRGDAMAEGCPFPNMAKGDDPCKWYADLWEQINGAGSWGANPWVWCVSFKVVKP